jgi:hypothetical protein
MKQRFKVDDRVIWNSEAGRVSGKIVKVHTKDLDYKGYTHHASRDAARIIFRTNCGSSCAITCEMKPPREKPSQVDLLQAQGPNTRPRPVPSRPPSWA